jgi:hypothetical protein
VLSQRFYRTSERKASTLVNPTKNIYAFNLLKSSTIALAPDYAYLVSRLIDVENSQSTGQSKTIDFAKQILDSYRSAQIGFDVSRVCLSFAAPFAKKLTILSSCNAEEPGPADLVPGYHCYVAPASSLFSLPYVGIEYGRIRSYSNIDHVAKLSATGFKSGLSITLALGTWGTGVLFLNSKTIGAFDGFEDADYLSTCILRMVATTALYRSEHVPSYLDEQMVATVSTLAQMPNVCRPVPFAESLQKSLALRFGRRFQVKVEPYAGEPFFYPSATAILIALKTIETLQCQSHSDLTLTFTCKAESQMGIGFDFSKPIHHNSEQSFSMVSSFAKSAGFNSHFHPAGFELVTSFQRANGIEQRCDYSVI